MVHIDYTVTTRKCPKCGQILEQKSDLGRTIFFIIFLPIFVVYVIYGLSYLILSEYILNVYVPSVGDPYIICPKCKTKINSGKKTYKQLDNIEKLLYDNRWLFRIAYFFGGTMIISLLLIFLKLSKNPIDRDWGTAAIISAIVCFIMVLFICFYWMYKMRNAIIANSEEIHSVKPLNLQKTNNALESSNRIQNVQTERNENISNLLNISDIDFPDNAIKNIQQDLDIHKKENLPEFFKKCKQDKSKEIMLDIAKTFVYMYRRDDKLLLTHKDNGIPIVNTAFGRYFPIYTEQKYFNNLVGNHYEKKGTRTIFEMFYLLNKCNKCEGIVFNYGTDNMLLLPKITIDNFGLDLFFDVPWKK